MESPQSVLRAEALERKLGRIERMVLLIAEALIYESDMPMENSVEMLELIKKVRKEYADKGEMKEWKYVP